MTLEIGQGPGGISTSTDSGRILDYVKVELFKIIRALNVGQNYVRLVPQNRPIEKPRDGMMIYADGSNYDPGDGEGFYGYENGSWVKL